MHTVISDEYVDSLATTLKEESENIEATLNHYINLLQGIKDSGFMQGNTSEALEAFIEQASLLKGALSQTVAPTIDVECQNYIRKIDEADEYLYN